MCIENGGLVPDVPRISGSPAPRPLASSVPPLLCCALGFRVPRPRIPGHPRSLIFVLFCWLYLFVGLVGLGGPPCKTASKLKQSKQSKAQPSRASKAKQSRATAKAKQIMHSKAEPTKQSTAKASKAKGGNHKALLCNQHN